MTAVAKKERPCSFFLFLAHSFAPFPAPSHLVSFLHSLLCFKTAIVPIGNSWVDSTSLYSRISFLFSVWLLAKLLFLSGECVRLASSGCQTSMRGRAEEAVEEREEKENLFKNSGKPTS